MSDDGLDEVDGGSPVLQKDLAVKAAESLRVIEEDLSEWLAQLLHIDITADKFLRVLDTGVQLCRLVGAIQAHTKELRDEQNAKLATTEQQLNAVPMAPLKFRETAEQGTFFARDNAANFIVWCRCFGIDESILFESDDLVMHRDEKRVVLTLLEISRRVARLGMASTQLALMDIEIDEEEKAPTTPPLTNQKPASNAPEKKKPAPHPQPVNLAESVMKIINQCQCHPKITVEHHGKGKFRMDRHGKDYVIMARFLRDRIMVRVGGGWIILEEFLLKHDPCRIRSLQVVDPS